jgi:putative hemolysin
VPLLKFISRIFAQFTGAPVSAKAAISVVRPPYIRAILQETREEGIFSPTQTDIINRLESISNIRIKSVMTPISKVQMVDVNFDNAALLNKLKQSAFARLLVYDRWPANIVGFINIYQALSSAQEFTDLNNFIEPIPKLPADTIVTEAINIMQRENQKIVLVTKTVHVGAEKPIGIVTMKDLVEELLGELAEW